MNSTRLVRLNPQCTWGWILASLLMITSPAVAMDFHAEQLVSTGAGTPTAPAIDLDPVDNVFVAYADGTEVRLNMGPEFLGGGFAIATGGNPETPSIFTSGAVSTVAYEWVDGIRVVQNLGGPFGAPMDLSTTTGPDSKPKLSGSSGVLHLVWIHDAAGGAEVMFSENLAMATSVALGSQVEVATDSSGVPHIAYERGGDLYYRAGTGAGTIGAEQTLALGANQVALGVDDTGSPHAVYRQGADVFYVRGNGGGGFTAPVNISSTPTSASTSPKLNVGGTGVVQVFYLEANDVWNAAGVGSFFTAPEAVTDTPSDPEDQLAVSIDASGFSHVTYRRAGQLYYRNDVPTPTAAFDFDPLLGDTPLDVQFTDLSTGAITSWLWDFGDGNTSVQQHPSHTYVIAGTYDVTLTVTGPGGSDTLVVDDAVHAVSPANFLRIPDISVVQGQTNVHLPVLATHPDPLQGYQVAVTWDMDQFDVSGMEVASTEVEILFPEFIGTQLNQDASGVYLAVGVLFDTETPFDQRTLAPGVDQRLINIIFDVSPTADTSAPSTFDLTNGIGNPPITNVFTVNSVSIPPSLTDGEITVVPAAGAPSLFIRGDLDQDGGVAIPDVIIVLNYLFASGFAPPCFDAADGNDDGAVDIADPIFLLNWKFGQGAVMPYPFPTEGLDATPDNLPDC